MFRRWIYTLPLRLRSMFRRSNVERELDDELRFHLEARIQHEIAAGRTPEEARYAALRAMEGIEQRKEECREQRAAASAALRRARPAGDAVRRDAVGLIHVYGNGTGSGRGCGGRESHSGLARRADRSGYGAAAGVSLE
jgi:hypothetical protein